MKRGLRVTSFLIAAMAVGGILVPASAEASTIYPPAGSCTASPATVAPGGTVEFGCLADTFSPDEDITVTVRGENGAAARIGMIRLAITTASGHARSAPDGSVDVVSLALPSDASGTYNIAAVSATSAGGSAAITITAADGSLSTTGLASGSLLGIWVGGAALVLAGVALAIGAVARLRRTPR